MIIIIRTGLCVRGFKETRMRSMEIGLWAQEELGREPKGNLMFSAASFCFLFNLALEEISIYKTILSLSEAGGWFKSTGLEMQRKIQEKRRGHHWHMSERLEIFAGRIWSSCNIKRIYRFCLGELNIQLSVSHSLANLFSVIVMES